MYRKSLATLHRAVTKIKLIRFSGSILASIDNLYVMRLQYQAIFFKLIKKFRRNRADLLNLFMGIYSAMLL